MIHHLEIHQTQRIGWLRAAVLGTNDGIISTASLILGLMASGAHLQTTIISSIAALIAGSMSMAAGEYVSVHSQKDIEHADLAKEQAELLANPEHEHQELSAIYQSRGVDINTANLVATQLMAHDALGAHARDELGITEVLKARPIQAALSSALAFAIGAMLPILTMVGIQSMPVYISSNLVIMFSTVVCLFFLGWIAAKTGGMHGTKNVLIAALRVAVWGILAMTVSLITGNLLGNIHTVTI